MKKRLLIVVGALALGLMLVPAAVPAHAATVYQVQNRETYTKLDTSWQKTWSMKTTYNKKGLVTSYVNKSYDLTSTSPSSTTKDKYTYDSKGRTKTSKTYHDGKLMTHSKYKYGKNKTTIKHYIGKKYTGKSITKQTSKKSTTTSYDTKGKIVDKSITKFDKKGNVKSYAVYAGSKLNYKTVNTIKKGKITKSVDYNYENGKKTGKTTSKYSYSGKYTIQKTYNNAGQLESHSKYYTEKKTGNQINVWSKHYYEGKLTTKNTYKTKKYTSGKCKGLVKQVTTYVDGKAQSKEVYKIKAVKVK